jgi:pimeloyl-ACP methyl ester carboxylesterase
MKKLEIIADRAIHDAVLPNHHRPHHPMFKTLASILAVAALLPLAGCIHPPQSSNAGSHFAKFGTNNIHYVVEGGGAHTIVFVHCWSGNLGFWREQVPAFAGRARLIFIDLPGHGRSDQPHVAYTMDYFAEAVLAVMNDAHVDKATLVGHSMGAAVICRVYHQAPQRVAALVSADGLLRRPPMTPEQVEQFLAQFRGPDYREQTRQFINTMFPVAGTEAVRDRVIAEMLETPQYVLLGAMEGMFGTNQPDWDIRHADVPVLVINAPNPMWTDEYKEYVHSLSSQTDYRMIDGTGHWLMLEKPAEFNAVLTDLLRRHNLIGN